MGGTIYDQLGMCPVINARGIYTDLGGWRPSGRVWEAMEAANRSYVDMVTLLEVTGQIIADLVGAEAARVTPGATAGIALATAACMTGTDPDKVEQLPDVTGLKHQVLIQAVHRYRWDKFVMLPGARLHEIGDAAGTSRAAFQAALTDEICAVLHVGHLDGVSGGLPLTEVARLAHERGVPVVVDAAYLNYPTDRFGAILREGADLAIFSAKYFGGPNSGGFVCGRQDLIDAVACNDFSKAGSRGEHAIGRGFKLDRQFVVGVVESLREWFDIDHGARFEHYEQLVQGIAGQLRNVEGIMLTPMCLTMDEELQPEPINCLVVHVDPASGRAAAQIAEQLAGDNPAIYVHQRDDDLIIDVECLEDDEARLIGQRLREVLQHRAK